MIKKNKKKVLRHFQLKIRNKEHAATFDSFQRKMIFLGLNVTDVVMDDINGRDVRTIFDFTLLTEPEMLALMVKKGVSRTRQSLKRMRDRGELIDPITKEKLWGTDGATIIYNSEAVIKLLSNKGQKGKKKKSGKVSSKAVKR